MDDLDRRGAVFAVLMLCGFALALALMVTGARANAGEATCPAAICADAGLAAVVVQPRFAARS